MYVARDKSNVGYKTEAAEALSFSPLSLSLSLSVSILVVYFAIAQPQNTRPLPSVHYGVFCGAMQRGGRLESL